ncbi:PREDICTED: UPF0687 protein C20orf27 homolog isoform X3 [Miniopterus natalensis]|uniref:UPF0687 protein C20orf27 homolog isoform X3 n=1 Tax=Miniopterus natalensis TaxID=291302 RepID=UPI0007A6AD38|nr:PREDICTED: UPF0687 protein C20orf27 homolog isoform X3 [Miniopterus natalensis]XP_016067562.1 PREDICTED: UPF0687 protein C20orf27 homolog isoform X3 [Miniopterus natalensis]
MAGRASMAAANKGNKPRVRSIRFAAGHDAEGSQSHVHFDEKLHDSVVMVTQESDSSFLVKVGFLKILHRYEITFTLPSVQRLSKDIREAPVPSLHLKLLSIMPVPEGWTVNSAARDMIPLYGLAVWQLGRCHASGLTPWTEAHGLTLLAYVCPLPDSFLSGMMGATEELALDLQPSLHHFPQEKPAGASNCTAPS